MSGTRVLIVEDELVIALGIRSSLERAGLAVAGVARTCDEAVAMARELSPDLILMDILLDGTGDGIEAARRIRREADVPIIYLTANADAATVDRARDTLPCGYLNKPVNDRDLLTNIDSALQIHRAERRLRASEEKYRTLIESLNDIILSADENGIVTYISPRVRDVAGYDPSEIVGASFASFIYPEDLPKVAALFEASKKGGTQRGEYRGVTKSGRVIWLRTSGMAAFVDGRFAGVRGILSDITRQKEVEEESERGAKFMAALFDSIQDGISVLDTDLTVMRVNDVMKRWYRHALPLEGKKCYEAYHGRGAPCEVCPSRRALLSGSLEVDLVPLVGADGATGTLELFSYPLKDTEGRITGIVEFVRDVTARVRAEEALRGTNQDLIATNEALEAAVEELEATNEEFEQQNRELAEARNELDEREAMLRTILRVAPVGIGMIVDRTVRWSNRGFHEMTGYSEEEIRGTSTRVLYPSDEEYERAGEVFYAKIAERGTGSMETRWKRRDGTVIDVAVRGTMINVRDRAAGIIITAQDVTGQKRAMEALVESEERFRTIIEYAPLSIAVIDGAGVISYLNRAFTAQTGYTPDLTPTMAAWWNTAFPDAAYRERAIENWNESVRVARHGGTVNPIEGLVRCADGSMRTFEFRMMPIGDNLLTMMNDITEKKITSEMMIQTEKMASIGGLAAGMAHEINNPLGIILQGAQGALDRIDPGVKANRDAAARLGTSLEAVRAYLEDRDIIEYLNGITEAGERAARIISSMLQFSRRGHAAVAPVDLRELAERTIALARSDYDLKKRYDFNAIEIRRDFGDDLPPVPCSETGIEQVILNLLKNAAQALRSPGQGDRRPVITLRTRREGDFAVIEVADNGPGIERALQRRIFEPFFTTKPAGKGTGLGLSVSSYIVTRNHGGSLTVESAPGKGAIFTVRLPLEQREGERVQ